MTVLTHCFGGATVHDVSDSIPGSRQKSAIGMLGMKMIGCTPVYYNIAHVVGWSP